MNTATPGNEDPREQRIAELRQRRFARLRWLAVRAGILSVAVALLAGVFLYWLLTSIGGRDLLMAQIVARLPDNATLSWRSLEGPLSGPLTLNGVRFTYDRIVFTAERVHIDPAIRPLIRRRLRLDALQIRNATLEIPKSDEPFELPRWPEVLPEIAPPLELQAEDVRVDGFLLTQEKEKLIDVRTLRGGLDAREGRLHVERVFVDSDRGRFNLHGDYLPREDYRTDLTASAVLPAADGRTPARVGVVARGDLSRMNVAIAGHVPSPLHASLVLHGRDEPRWRLDADAEGLDLGLLTGAEARDDDQPIVFSFSADGMGGAADLRGELRRGDLVATVLPSKVKLENQVLDVQPLALRIFGGEATLRGTADFTDAANARFRFAANARGLTFGGTTTVAAAAPNPPASVSARKLQQATTQAPQGAQEVPVAIGVDADLGFAGTLKSWAAIGNATLRRDREQATVRFDGRGNDERMVLKTLQARMPSGTLDGTGTVAWAPSLSWNLDTTLAGFDPGYFAADWKGSVNGKLTTTGRTRDDGGLEIVADASQLGGRLRNRPLQGRAHFTMHGAGTAGGETAYEGDVALTLGGSRIDAKGRVASALDIDATFAPLVLSDLLPGGAGTLRGTLQVKGPRAAPDVVADLTGSGLKYGDYRADTFTAKGRLPWQRGNGAIAVRATGLEVGLPLSSVTLDARGAVESLHLQGEAHGDIGHLTLAGDAARRGTTWQGALSAFQLAPTRGASWHLQQAARFSWDGRNGSLSNSCFVSSGGGSLCASADWPRRGLAVNGDALPLSLLVPYLPEREDGRPWVLRGEISLDGQLRPAGNAWRGEVHVRSAGGGLKNSARSRREVLNYDNLVLDATFDPRRIHAELGTAFNSGGRIEASITTGWDDYAPLSGNVAVNTTELVWLELFSPDIMEPKGRLDARLTLGGTRARPQIGGQARLSEFSTEIPSLAIVLDNGDVHLDALPDGTARIAGSIRSGEGTLKVDGTLNWQDTTAPLLLTVRGQNVLVSDTRDLHAVASPDLQVRYAAGQPITVTGTVTVPSARIDLERLDQGVSASPDVVVLDPEDPERTAASPLDLDLALVLGDDVRLNGFGLEGGLGGRMRVRSHPGREMTASGQLQVHGTYKAYGQELNITRGELSWSGGPVSDPILNVRAERVVGDVTAGVDIRGRASAPTATVWSDPASSQSEALAYLTLGRPLASASSDESRQVTAASAALSAGGSLIASQLGAKLGLDDAGVSESRALGGSVLGVGKHLSPRLYVGYGVSLLGTGQVLMLKYLLRKGFDVQIESSTVENRASINWRREK
ncbi:translocation/assembly module TamB domain-containing protein [Lysobacter sp. LF1]|uniref:Translocation/assembly module TamB domain-containing protein n=1 Tax=Lysobacter stagni TaxID=3045172 RepID=A0ABT6XE33_9GAMM|nr:translocation/assembly module TamB domain-containing protein [Lysobacter sp. LF1]MDI9238175.1 translocation/assembly module TamB domain-containing protein [Lysobacter sp. LF1]